MECIVDHSGHEFVRKEESGKLQEFNHNLYSLHSQRKWGENYIEYREPCHKNRYPYKPRLRFDKRSKTQESENDGLN